MQSFIYYTPKVDQKEEIIKEKKVAILQKDTDREPVQEINQETEDKKYNNEVEKIEVRPFDKNSKGEILNNENEEKIII